MDYSRKTYIRGNAVAIGLFLLAFGATVFFTYSWLDNQVQQRSIGTIMGADSIAIRYNIFVPASGTSVMISSHYKNIYPNGRIFMADSILHEDSLDYVPSSTSQIEQFIKETQKYNSYQKYRKEKGGKPKWRTRQTKLSSHDTLR